MMKPYYKNDKKNREKSRNQRVPRSIDSGASGHLPQLVDQLQTGMTLRFVTTGNVNSASVTITFQNLLDSWCVAVSATAARQLFDFIKIKRVTLRAVQNTAASGVGSTGVLGQGCTVGIEFPGLVAGTNAGGKQASDSALGTANVAVVSLRPDRMSAAAQWQASTGNVAFVLRSTDVSGNLVVGSIIDVQCAFKNSADVSPAAVASAVTGATTGGIYFRGIDGSFPSATWARSVFPERI